MSYIGNSPETNAAVNKYEYTATSGQTTFNCVYDSRVDVFLNGVLLSTDDYTATTGTEIVLLTGAALDDIVNIDAFQDVANVPEELPSQTGNANKYLQTDGNNPSWALITGGATGAGGDAIFVENERIMTTDYTLSTGKSASMVGPLTINTGVSLTIPAGESLVIL